MSNTAGHGAGVVGQRKLPSRAPGGMETWRLSELHAIGEAARADVMFGALEEEVPWDAHAGRRMARHSTALEAGRIGLAR